MQYPLRPDLREFTLPHDLIAALAQAGKLDDSLLVLLSVRDYSLLAITGNSCFGLSSVFTGPIVRRDGECFFRVYADDDWDMLDFSVGVYQGKLSFTNHMWLTPKQTEIDLADPELVEKVWKWFRRHEEWPPPEIDWLGGQTFENGPILFRDDKILPDLLLYLAGEWAAGHFVTDPDDLEAVRVDRVRRVIRRRILEAQGRT